MRVAVIGGGIAGLSVAWRLQQRHEVTLYERHARPGMDAFSVDLGPRWSNARVDVPLRVFFAGYYRSLIALYRRLGIDIERVDYASSFSRLREERPSEARPYFAYRNMYAAGVSFPYMWPGTLLRRPTRHIVGGFATFLRRARRDLAEDRFEGLSLETWLRRRGLSEIFSEGFLIPGFAGLCTCSYASVRAYPAQRIAEYLLSGLLTSGVRRVVQGAAEVVRRLAAPLSELRLGTAVTALRPIEAGIEVDDQRGETRRFDHVVLATQANHGQALLPERAHAERRALARFRYEGSTLITHTDERLAPPAARRASVNYFLCEGAERPMVTIWINAVQPKLRHAPPVFETWSPQREPAEGKLLRSTWFERPVVDADSERGVAEIARMHGESDRRLWLCGSYASPGIPLLESAVRSGESIARHLGA